MKKGDKLFVRVDYRIEGTEFGTTDFDDHIKYIKSVSKERYLIGGGFEKENGGMIIFKAKDLDEAKKIADNDPLIKRNLYSYDLYEWNLMILSEDVKKQVT